MAHICPEIPMYLLLGYGKTLWRSVQKYKCTVTEIVGLNGIKDLKRVPMGTGIKIPQK